MKYAVFAALVATALIIPEESPAGLIVEYTSSTGTMSSTFPGQSLSFSGGAIYEVEFNWFNDHPATSPTAFGTLFILDTDPTGSVSPADMSDTTPGYVGSSTSIVSGVYQFPAAMTLDPGKQYYFLTDTAGVTSVDADAGYAGGEMYATPASTVDWAPFMPSYDRPFRLSGEPIPEPSTFALCSLLGAAVAIGAWRRRRKR